MSDEKSGDGDLEHSSISDDVPPVPRFLNRLFDEARRVGATSIDLEPDEDGWLTVRLLIDDATTPTTLGSVSKAMRPGVIGRLKSMAAIDKTERRFAQEGSFSLVGEDGRTIEWQVTTSPFGAFEQAKLRVSLASRSLRTFDDLPLSAAALSGVKATLDRGQGLVLVTGSRDTGKQVLLDACLHYVSSPDRTLLSIVEEARPQIDGVQSTLVDHLSGNTIDRLLEAAVRSDVDVVRVCEIRDVPTTKLAIQAALDGRLILATIPMMDAPAAVPRLFDAWVDPENAALALTLVIGVVRVRRLCPAGEASAPGDDGAHAECDECGGTGFSGWATAYQVVAVDDEIRAAIRGGDPGNIRDAFQASGGSLRDAAVGLVEQGVTTMEEAVAQTPD